MPFYDVVALGGGRVVVGSHGDRNEATLHGWSRRDGDAHWEAALGPIYALASDPERGLVAAGGDAGVVHFRQPSGAVAGSAPLPEVGAAVEDAWFPAVAEFESLGTANAVTALAFDGSGETILVGTSGGAILQVPVPTE